MKYLKHFEDGDGVKLSSGVYTHWTDNDAKPFAYNEYMDEDVQYDEVPYLVIGVDVSVGEESTTHRSNDLQKSDGWKGSGRFWLDRKVLSFWEEPKDYLAVIEELEKVTGLKIINNDWLIETFDNDIEYNTIVPIEDYTGTKFDKDKYELHLLSPVEKAKKLKELGYKPKTPSKWQKHMKPFEAMKYSTLNEDPNYVKQKSGVSIDWWKNKENIAFSYYENDNLEYKFFSGKGMTHDRLLDNARKEDNFVDQSHRGRMSGRLFVDEKIITFWKFPKNEEEMRELATDIKRETGIDIYENNTAFKKMGWKDGWKVETLVKARDMEKHLKSGSNNYNDDLQLVPIRSFLFDGVERSEEELKAPHLMNWKEKDEWKKNNNYKGKSSPWKKHMKPFESFTLNENPNYLDIPGKDSITWHQYYDNIVFSYYMVDGKYRLFTDKGEKTHFNLLNDNLPDYCNGIVESEDEVDYNGRGRMSGRLFVEEKIITFWRFPKSEEEMKELSTDLKKETGIDIYDGWRIEALINDEEMENHIKGNKNNNNDELHIIPVKDFVFGVERSEEELKAPHLMNWEEKEEWKKNNNYKGKSSPWKKHMKPFESFTLNESPDNANILGDDGIMTHLRLHDDDSVSFTTDENDDKVVVSFDTGKGHSEMMHDFRERKLPIPSGSARSKYSGRLWLKRKIISFWEANVEDNFEYLTQLENELKEKGHIQETDTIFGTGWVVEKYNGEIEPIEDFSGHEFNEEDYKIHLLSPEEKNKKMRELGYKPKEPSKWKKHMKPFENFNN